MSVVKLPPLVLFFGGCYHFVLEDVLVVWCVGVLGVIREYGCGIFECVKWLGGVRSRHVVCLVLVREEELRGVVEDASKTDANNRLHN